MAIRGSATSRRSHAAEPLMERRQTPLYFRLKHAVRERILRGDLAPGQPAPSEAMLRAEFGVSSTTARRCLNDLEHDGYVQRVQGRGTFVCDRDLIKSTRHLGVFYHELVNLTYTFASSVLRGIFEQVGQGPCQPELISSALVRHATNPSAMLAEIIRQRRVDGLLVLSPTPQPWLGAVLAAGIPVVSVNMEYEDPRIYGVINDFGGGMNQLLDRLIKLGHRKMVVLKEVFPETPQGILSSRAPHWGREGLDCDFETLAYASRPDCVEAVLERHLANPNPATVFVALGYELALQVRHLLKKMGRAIPEEVSVVLLGVPPGPSVFHQMVIPASAIGAEAARMLATLMVGHHPLSRMTRIAVQMVEGETLGPSPSLSRPPAFPETPVIGQLENIPTGALA